MELFIELDALKVHECVMTLLSFFFLLFIHKANYKATGC